MDERTLANLQDAGCDEAFVAEFDKAASECARICLLKGYRRELLNGIHAEQKKLEYLDFLIHQLRTADVGGCACECKREE